MRKPILFVVAAVALLTVAVGSGAGAPERAHAAQSIDPTSCGGHRPTPTARAYPRT